MSRALIAAARMRTSAVLGSRWDGFGTLVFRCRFSNASVERQLVDFALWICHADGIVGTDEQRKS